MSEKLYLLDNKEIAKRIRKEIKEIGYTNKQVKVSVKPSLYDTLISLKVFDLHVDMNNLKYVTSKYENYSYDDYTGEILQGGNTFVNIDYDNEIIREERKQYEKACEKIINEHSMNKINYKIYEDNDLLILYVTKYNDTSMCSGYLKVIPKNCDVDNYSYMANTYQIMSEGIVIINAKYGINIKL